MSKRHVTSDMPLESICSTTIKSYDISHNDGMKMFILPPNILQDISVTGNVANVSTSTERISLSEIEVNSNKALDNKHSSIKHVKCKYENKSDNLDTHDNYAHKNILFPTEKSSKDPVCLDANNPSKVEQEMDTGTEHVERKNETSIRLCNLTEVPISHELVASQNTISESVLMPTMCLNNSVNTIGTPKRKSRMNAKKWNLRCTAMRAFKKEHPSTNKHKVKTLFMQTRKTNDNSTSKKCNKGTLHKRQTEEGINGSIDNKNMPPHGKKRDRKTKETKINDRITSNSPSQEVLLTDNDLLRTEMHTENQGERKQYCLLSDKKVTTDQRLKIEEVKREITAVPAKPTRSLSSDIELARENTNEKKCKLVDVKNNLAGLTRLCADFRMQLRLADGNNPIRSIIDCTMCDEKGSMIAQQIPSQTFDGDVSSQGLVPEIAYENINLQNTNNETHAYKINEASVKNSEQNQLSMSIISNVRKRSESREITSSCIDQNMLNKYKGDDVMPESSSIITESTARDKRCASKIITADISDLNDENDISDIVEEKVPVKRRGRPPGRRGNRGRGRKINCLGTEHITKIMEKDASQFQIMKSNESNTDINAQANLDDEEIKSSTTDTDILNIEKKIQFVTCTKCNQQTSKKQWSSHNLYRHNNMAWQENEQPLDFDNDVKLLKKVLTCAIKKKKKLTCEKCEATKRSVNGFISHMQFCGKSTEERQALMMTCSICKAVMMPSSMEVHERYHRKLQENKNEETAIIQAGKTKRKAAEKAIPKILELIESMREQNPIKRTKLDSATFKDVIQMPELKKKIPTVWKSLWRKELVSKGIISCKQVGCTYMCSSYETMCEHYSQCNFTPQEDFMCKICKFCADSKDKIINHITKIHSNDRDLEKYSDFEKDEEYSSDESIVESGTKRKHCSLKAIQINSDSTRIGNKMAFLNKEPIPKSQSTKVYKAAFHWTMAFELKNYELELFENYLPNVFTLLENNDAAKYLPELTISMAIKCVNAHSSENVENLDNDDWKCINRFEGDIYKAVPTFFVGGPIWALAWLPIPSPMYIKNPAQYVAISTHPTMESEYVVGKKYSGPNIIQIWDIGNLNHEFNNINKSPYLAYAIAHNNGTIWCLEWCPSGCYQDIELCNYKIEENKFRRMGLLAAACSNGCVNIYSLPFPDELKFEKTEYNSWPVYKTDPIITLVVNLSMYNNNKQDWQCTKLSWTKEHGHNIIAAGFTNGYIALWDLAFNSSPSYSIQKNTRFINAFQHFFAHSNAVSMVALVPYHGKRFLASAGVDRLYKFWDLEDTSVPQNCTKKGIIVDGAWMTHWPCSVISFDDALGFNYTHSYVISLREYGYKYCPILATNAPTYSITVSDYANGIAHGTLAGEVVTIFPHQLLYTEKFLPKKRQLNSFIKMVDFLEEHNISDKNNGSKIDKRNSKDYHYMPETYNECKDRFGIIFHDNLIDLKEDTNRDKQQETLYNDKLMSIPIEQYPFTSANKMAWNPNAWSYLWLMVGYQNGLIRLLNLKFMSTSHEIKSLLPSHAESLLRKRNSSV